MRKRNPDGIARAARAQACSRCGACTFRGLDADAGAFAVRVDAYPLDAAGELLALVAGRRTYTLRWIPGRARYEIDRRESLDIESHPPGEDVNADVVAVHQCNAAPLPRARTTIQRARKRVMLTDEPPF